MPGTGIRCLSNAVRSVSRCLVFLGLCVCCMMLDPDIGSDRTSWHKVYKELTGNVHQLPARALFRCAVLTQRAGSEVAGAPKVKVEEEPEKKKRKKGDSDSEKEEKKSEKKKKKKKADSDEEGSDVSLRLLIARVCMAVFMLMMQMTACLMATRMMIACTMMVMARMQAVPCIYIF
eukprot:1177806-Rhodomonas_salina.5